MELIISIVILLFSAILHEVMHGFTAFKLGDPTAKDAGRLTLNPIPHIDPLTSLFIPFLLIVSGSPIIFGAAKPVPVNPIYFKEGRKDMALVALSGPLTNISLAVLAAALFRLLAPFQTEFLGEILFRIVTINLVLGIINLIPIPPVDGSRIFSIVLPDSLAALYYSLEPFGIFILFFFLLFPIGGFSLAMLIQQLIVFSLRFLGFG